MWLPASLLCFASLLVHIYCKEVFGIVGENFTFPVEINKRNTEITWKKDKDKVAERDEQNTPTYFTPLQNRSMLKENGCLTIFNLEKNDAGAYELQYWDSLKDHSLYFKLIVLDPPSEPKINCSIRGENLVLKCTSDFPRPLNYSWQFGNNQRTHQSQEYSIAIRSVGGTEKATCFIAFLHMEKSSEISMFQCFPNKQVGNSHQRTRVPLIVAFILFLFILPVGVLVFKRVRGRATFGREIVTQKNSPKHGSGEHEKLFPGDNREQHDSVQVKFSQAVPCESEQAEADRELNQEDGALKDEQTVNNSVNQEEITQDAEDRKGEHLKNSSSCSNEDLKS